MSRTLCVTESRGSLPAPHDLRGACRTGTPPQQDVGQSSAGKFHNVAPEKPGFLEELKRRHVWRAAVTYAVASWLLIQIATQIFPFFNIPNWAVRLIVLLRASVVRRLWAGCNASPRCRFAVLPFNRDRSRQPKTGSCPGAGFAVRRPACGHRSRLPCWYRLPPRKANVRCGWRGHRVAPGRHRYV